jgi:tRNA (guanine37-N1)-methyltransferase
MKITIITLFPEMFNGPFDSSILKHAQAKGLVEIEYIQLRNYGLGTHKLVDDTPYGGGIGMVLRVDVVHSAIKSARCQPEGSCAEKIILLTASGSLFTQMKAKEYTGLDHLIIICGHYEGIDDRIRQYIDEEISIGDFVVTGGEIPAMLITDAVVRLLPHVLKKGVTDNESFSFQPDTISLLEYPQYTRPPEYEGNKVPEVLLSGNHANIDKWRKEQAQYKTQTVRPDLLSEKKENSRQ